MVRKSVWVLMLIFLSVNGYAQINYNWHDAKWAIGVCEPDSAHVFYRLPTRIQSLVSKGAWNQSTAAAGEYLHIKTTARSFLIKYKLANKVYALPHMAATGVSGLDLYAKDINGAWNWSPPVKYTFGDTCVYEYRNLKVAARNSVEFFLYLPLYASLQWISVGVPQGQSFEYLKPDADKPIVAYGTSILQGAVASRPGQAWTNMLERNLGRKVINLGFSGNGRFEAAIFDLMANVNARLYILDCMPNLFIKKYFPADTVRARLLYGLNKLHEQHPDVPILLAEHADGSLPMDMDTATVKIYHQASLMITGIFNELKAKGTENLYMLTEKDINFDINSTTDGTHPNDIGMMKYTLAYEKKIREILHEPTGSLATQQPAEQYRDGFDWRKRHEDIIANTIKTNPKAIIFGNSIINYWGGEPKPEKVTGRGEAAWQQYMVPADVQNAGFGNDRIENVLWRVYHGELDHFNGNKIIVTIGTNNLAWNTDDEIAQGLAFLVQQIRYRKPNAVIFLGTILPRKNMLQRVLALNLKIKKIAALQSCKFFDFSKVFMNGNLLNDALFMTDGLHPNENGYEVLGKMLRNVLD
jgi:lysophospholipase L1-like esterase